MTQIKKVKTSDLTNDSGFITSADVPEGATAFGSTPLMDGTAAVGTETAFARGNKSNTTIYYTCGSKAGTSGSHTISLNTTYVFEMTRDSLTLNGTSRTFTPATGTANTGKLAIFGSASKGSFTRGKLYYFKVWDGNTLIFDFIPVRVGTVGYLYDKVSGELFGNSGTGSFTLGSDV